MSLLSLNQTEKIDHEVQASACRIESLSEQWLTFQMNEFSPYLGMTPSMGEAERFKLLLDEMPHLRSKVEGDYLEARDRSSRLLGHLRAIEKTLKTLAAPR